MGGNVDIEKRIPQRAGLVVLHATYVTGLRIHGINRCVRDGCSESRGINYSAQPSSAVFYISQDWNA
jgi:hypothetical protein